MIKEFTNQYPISKTLRFKLIPVGKTEENFNAKLMLAQDKQRAESYQKVKKYMDEYHKSFIESVLSKFILNGVDEYAELYYKPGKSDIDKKDMEKIEAKMRKEISLAFSADSRYKFLNKKEFVRDLLPDFLTDDDEKNTVKEFDDFTTYFTGFWQNRENMYSAEEQSTAISYRCINENLPKFLDNVKSFIKIKENLPAETLSRLNNDFSGLCGTTVEDIFSIDYFSFVLSQSGIDRYNEVVGGYKTTDGTKVQGINENINQYNQQVAKNDKSKRLPLMKPLFKQILSDRGSVSFIPESYKSDDELLESIKKFYDETKDSLKELSDLFNDFSLYNLNGVYILNGLGLTDLSKQVFDSWSFVSENWNKKYEKDHTCKSGKEEKFYDDERKAYKNIKSFSIEEIQELTKCEAKKIPDYYTNKINEIIEKIGVSYKEIESLVSSPYIQAKKLSANEKEIDNIKAFLDLVKELEHLLKPLCGTGKEEEKDNEFYGKFLPQYDSIKIIDTLYDKVRNYLTQKPYSNEKIKLNFNISNLLNGWVDSKTESSDNGTQYGGYLFRKKNIIGEYDYFLGISTDKKLFRSFNEVHPNDKSEYERLDYYQPKGQTIYGSAYKGNKTYAEDKSEMFGIILACAESNCEKNYVDQLKVYASLEQSTPVGCLKRIMSDNPVFFDKLIKDESFTNKNNEIIDNLQKTIGSMPKFKSAQFIINKEYSLFFEVMDDIDSASKFKSFNYFNISKVELEKAFADDNKPLFMFKISNKDLEYAEKFNAGLREKRGTDNLHTMFFRAMMSGEQNVFDIGSGEVFYRESSIERHITHPAGIPMSGKNPLNNKEYIFAYDLIKDKRYSVDQFNLHISMQLNYSANKKKDINNEIKEAIKSNTNPYVIGIDRGERNLIYVTVINNEGKIVEQKSLNEIVGDNGYKVNYHTLLDIREKDQDKARKDWKTIGNIKELKEGYLSQVVHEICKLVVKYDAIIAMEDLNSGFMNSRVKVGKQVYQKFEKALTSKLNFLVDKKIEADKPGGLLHAYQLTNKADKSRTGQQDGIIFYIPAWLTSKIDPTTGFVNLLNTKYVSVQSSKEFFGLFDDITYNESTDMFEFDIDYDKFPRCQADSRKKWTICTNGERIKTFQNKDKNSQWDNEVVTLTPEFKNLFKKYGIDYNADLKSQIIMQDEKTFFGKLLGLLSLTLQMRNSITGNVDVDYLISPVRNADGKFYDSRDYEKVENPELPANADANGAYNIARKGLWAIERIKEAEDVTKVKLSISNKDWLEFAQNNE